MDRQRVAKEAIANFDKVHPNSSLEAKNFYIAGWLDGLEKFASLVKRMREAQQDTSTMRRIAYKWTVDDHYKYNDLLNEEIRLMSEVDEYLKKIEENV